jgi:hypothetical protein
MLVSPGDPRALAAAILSAEHRRLGAAAAVDVAARFAPQRMLDDVQALYDRLVI